MVRPADVRRIAQLPGVDSYMVRQNATADLVGANVAKVPGGDDYDATKEQQFGNAANVIGTNDSSKLNVFTSRTLGMAEGRHLKASDKYTSMIHEDLAKANGLKVGDTLTLKANAYDADNESHSTATVKTTIVGIFKGDSARKVSSRAELTANTIYTDLDTTRDLYQYKDGKEIYQDATFVLSKGVDVEKTMDAAKKLPVDWNNYQITRNDQYSSSMLHAARGVRSMMRGALIGVTVSAVLVLSLMLLLWMNDRRQEMGILVSLGVGKPSLVAQYLTEMVLIGLPSLALGWLCAICALYFVVLYLVIGEQVNLTPIAAVVLLGFVLVVCFGGMSPDKTFAQGLKAGLGNAFTVFLNTISAFGNIMSYIRLFAVGMASLAIAQSFNNMALGFKGPLVVVGILIMLVGHGLNIVMGLLSVVVHGVRLNLLEFSGQLGMEWTGTAYAPFKKLDKIRK